MIFKNRHLHKIENWIIRKRTGAGCCDTYSLYYYLAPQIAIALKRFKERKCSYPSQLSSMNEWDLILDDMIYAFEAVEKDDKGEEIDYERKYKGFKLFGEYYNCLWY